MFASASAFPDITLITKYQLLKNTVSYLQNLSSYNLNNPTLQAVMNPLTPYQLSTHLGTGSFTDDITEIKFNYTISYLLCINKLLNNSLMDGLNIPIGIPTALCRI